MIYSQLPWIRKRTLKQTWTFLKICESLTYRLFYCITNICDLQFWINSNIYFQRRTILLSRYRPVSLTSVWHLCHFCLVFAYWSIVDNWVFKYKLNWFLLLSLNKWCFVIILFTLMMAPEFQTFIICCVCSDCLRLMCIDQQPQGTDDQDLFITSS